MPARPAASVQRAGEFVADHAVAEALAVRDAADAVAGGELGILRGVDLPQRSAPGEFQREAVEGATFKGGKPAVNGRVRVRRLSAHGPGAPRRRR